jgi:GntR family transcriptional regulator of vanillate catabolism
VSERGLIVRLREMILSGGIAAGQRVTEAWLAELLGVSRTPIRSLLPALAGEGLLTPAGRRGYAVKAFSARESALAIEMRGAIEGLAGRIVAREGPSAALLTILDECLREGDGLFAKRYLNLEDELVYGRMNARFHSAIVAAAESGALAESYARIKLVPFAAPATIAFNQVGVEKAYDLLNYAHRQHHDIAAAIRAGDAGRAEFLFREHAHQPRASLWPPPGEPAQAKRRARRKPA